MFNWVDYIILIIVIYYIIQGWEFGLVNLLSNLVSFLISLWLAIRFHDVVSAFLSDKFGIASMWTNMLGYLLVAIAAETVISELFSLLLDQLPPIPISSRINRVLGALVSFMNSLVLVAFFLLVVLALPIRGSIKGDIKQSGVGSRLVLLADHYGGDIKSSLEQATQGAMKFLTVEPQSTERVSLNVVPKTSDLSVDATSETEMVTLVNNERTKRGLSQLRVDTAIVNVARAHSRDMFINRYFSHIDPQGHDAKDRMIAAGISFSIVGENLAYAPDVTTAHTGLMNSEGHKENILSTDWHRIGIGIIDSGAYGEMFTQLFAD